MAPKVVITGWSRGGLGYIYELLRSANQDVGNTFSDVLTEHDFESRLSAARTVEVSSGFVPFMTHPALQHTKFYFVLRDPMRVLNSLTFLGYFRYEKKSYPQKLAVQYLKRGKQYRGYPVKFGCYYLLAWLRRYKQNCQRLDRQPKFIRVEMGNQFILNQLGLSNHEAYVDRNINSSYCKQTLVPNVLKQPAKRTMQRLLQISHYRHSLWLPRGGHAHYINPDWHT